MHLGDRVKIESSSHELVLAGARGTTSEWVVLRAWLPHTTTVGEARQLVVIGQGYKSEDEANSAALAWRSTITIAFARAQIGVDFGDRALRGFVSEEHLQMLSEQQLGARFLRDTHGLTIYATEPPPKFVNLSATGVAGRFEEHVLGAIAVARANCLSMSTNHQIAYDLFSSSLSAVDTDARLLLLMMALETMMHQKPRQQAVQAHVTALIQATSIAALPEAERDSITGSLRRLHEQSISQAGRDLAATRGDRQYTNMSAKAFFSHCYGLRSQLVHGEDPRPTREEVDGVVATLEIFVSDLLSGPLLELVSTYEVGGPAREKWDAAIGNSGNDQASIPAESLE